MVPLAAVGTTGKIANVTTGSAIGRTNGAKGTIW